MISKSGFFSQTQVVQTLGGLGYSKVEAQGPSPDFCFSLEELCRSVAGTWSEIQGLGKHRVCTKLSSGDNPQSVRSQWAWNPWGGDSAWENPSRVQCSALTRQPRSSQHPPPPASLARAGAEGRGHRKVRDQCCLKKPRAPAAAQSLQRSTRTGRADTGALLPPLLPLVPGAWCWVQAHSLWHLETQPSWVRLVLGNWDASPVTRRLQQQQVRGRLGFRRRGPSAPEPGTPSSPHSPCVARRQILTVPRSSFRPGVFPLVLSLLLSPHTHHHHHYQFSCGFLVLSLTLCFSFSCFFNFAVPRCPVSLSLPDSHYLSHSLSLSLCLLFAHSLSLYLFLPLCHFSLSLGVALILSLSLIFILSPSVSHFFSHSLSLPLNLSHSVSLRRSPPAQHPCFLSRSPQLTHPDTCHRQYQVGWRMQWQCRIWGKGRGSQLTSSLHPATAALLRN